MISYPLTNMTLEEAVKAQFRFVDCMTRELDGHETLTRGDLGLARGLNKPLMTEKVERVIARYFQVDDCILIRGAGSGAVRMGLHAAMKPGDKVLVHKAPVYPTTEVSMQMLGLTPVEADYNDLSDIRRVLSEHGDIRGALVQYTRQQPQDRYEMKEVLGTIRECAPIPIITDDNYAVMKVKEIGAQCGADLSCFSAFKLMGPEGIGIVIGKGSYLSRLKAENYSGGMQVQGHEALDVLHGLVYAPVALAVSAQVTERCAKRLQTGEIPGVKAALVANAQSKVLLVEFEEGIAPEVLNEAQALGAAPHPVGAESKYEMAPMFYRISGTFSKMDPGLGDRMIRINPMRAGTDTVMRILKESVERVMACS